mmetsp:Transcript_49900/g.106947  ORF Transcript_49900/g.106947 Transcript_49900/m.106947 type:complete len:236 (-) Transcript_49900:275-982(-)
MIATPMNLYGFQSSCGDGATAPPSEVLAGHHHHARLHLLRHHPRHPRLLKALLWRCHGRVADGQIAEAGQAPRHHHGGHVVRHVIVRGTLLLLLLLFLFRGLLVKGIDTASVLPQDLDEVRHGEVRHPLPPCQLQSDVRAHEVVASVKASRKALLVACIGKVAQQALGQIRIAAVHCGLHGILEDAVLLRELDGLLEALVLLVDKCRDAAHLQELVPLELLRQGNLIEVVEILDG